MKYLLKTNHKILIAKIISKLLTIFISKNQNVNRNGIKWNLDLNEGIDLSLYLFGSFEDKITNLKKILPKKDKPLTFIDIGANIGSVSLVMAKMFDDLKIFAIEPTNYAFRKLSHNLNLNEELKKKVYLRQLFISNHKRPKSVWSSWNFEKSNEKHLKHSGTLKEIKQDSFLKLDEFIKEENLKDIDFIKLDVDGYELDVLNSGKEFFKNNRPIIFIEIAPYLYPEFGYTVFELINFMKKFNYDFFDEDLRRIPNIEKHVENIKDGSDRNFFLIHRT